MKRFISILLLSVFVVALSTSVAVGHLPYKGGTEASKTKTSPTTDFTNYLAVVEEPLNFYTPKFEDNTFCPIGEVVNKPMKQLTEGKNNTLIWLDAIKQCIC